MLKSDTEAIQQNVGQSLAALVAGDLESRKNVMQTIRDAYKLRSAFLHHGSEKEDLVVLEKLQHHVWDGLRNATLSRRNYATNLDLAQTLEDHLLG